MLPSSQGHGPAVGANPVRQLVLERDLDLVDLAAQDFV